MNRKMKVALGYSAPLIGALILVCSASFAHASVGWVGVPDDPSVPMAFEDPNNWFPFNDPNNSPSAGPELAPPGPDSIAFIPGGDPNAPDPNDPGYNFLPFDFEGKILLSEPRDGSNGTTNAKLGSIGVGGGSTDNVQQLIIAADVKFTGRERDEDGEISMSDPNTFDLREVRVGRQDETPYYVGAFNDPPAARTTINNTVPGFDQFPWGYVQQTAGTVELEFLDDPSQAQLKIVGDKESSAGGLWEVGGTASFFVGSHDPNNPLAGDPNDSDNGVTIGFKDTVNPGAIFRVRGSDVGTVQVGNRLVVSGLGSAWDVSDPDTFGSIVLAKMNRGKSILEFVLDEDGVTPIETTGELRIGSQVTNIVELTSTILYGFLRVKLSEPTTAGTGDPNDGLVLVRSDRITSSITVLDPNSETAQGVFYDPDRPGPDSFVEHRPILRDDNGSPGKVISDYAGVTYTWDITYFESTGGAIDGEISDAIVLSNLQITGGIEGDFDDLDGLDIKDLDALIAAQDSISLVDSMDSAQDMHDLNGDGLIDFLDVEMWITHPGFLDSALGDFDVDGDVDSDDRLIWESNYAMTNASYGDGDANFDSVINGRDFLIWQQNFTGALLVAANAAVPEPGTVVLLGIGLLLLAPTRRCSRSV